MSLAFEFDGTLISDEYRELHCRRPRQHADKRDALQISRVRKPSPCTRDFRVHDAHHCAAAITDHAEFEESSGELFPALREIFHHSCQSDVLGALWDRNVGYRTARAQRLEGRIAVDVSSLRLVISISRGDCSLPASQDAFASKACSGGVCP